MVYQKTREAGISVKHHMGRGAQSNDRGYSFVSKLTKSFFIKFHRRFLSVSRIA
jgi:hypothetical protein